jgi:hypothetical protein
MIAVAAAPQHVAFGPRAAYVASGEGRSVTVHGLTDGRVLRRARVPLVPLCAIADTRRTATQENSEPALRRGIQVG